ncbi:MULTISPECIES: hypothetical protein [Nocardia]|nr:hypothetical protein [Nocardia neocaledoniensis]
MEIGPYRVFGIHSDKVVTPKRVILDTNVAIDIEKFFFGTGKVDRDALRQLLHQFPLAVHRSQTVDVVYGFAVNESSWTRTGKHDPRRAQSLAVACDRMFSWTAAEIDRAFANRHPPVNRDKAWPRQSSVVGKPLLTDHPLRAVLVSYATVLHICHLDRTRAKWKHRGMPWAIERLTSWAENEFGALGSYEIAAAVRLFCGNSDEIRACRRVLKIGGNETPDAIADKAWNAAWDFVHVRLTDGLGLGLADRQTPPLPTCLVTRDIDPANIRLSTRTGIIIDGGGSDQMVGVLADYVPSKSSEKQRVASSLKMDPMTAYRRAQRDPMAVFDQAITELERLESEMGVTCSTVAGFRASQRR